MSAFATETDLIKSDITREGELMALAFGQSLGEDQSHVVKIEITGEVDDDKPLSTTAKCAHYIERAKYKGSKWRDKHGDHSNPDKKKDWSHLNSWEVYNYAVAPHIKGPNFTQEEEEQIALFIQKADQLAGSNGRIKTRSGTKLANIGSGKSTDSSLDHEIIAAAQKGGGSLSKDAAKRASRQIQRALKEGGGLGKLPDRVLRAYREVYSSLKNEFGTQICRKNQKISTPDKQSYVLPENQKDKTPEPKAGAPTPSSSPIEPKKCNYCRERGHNITRCPLRKRDIEEKAKGSKPKTDIPASAGASKCSYCNQPGHNIRTCPKKKEEEEASLATARRLQMDDQAPQATARASKCSYCNQPGHNIRTCPKKKEEEEASLATARRLQMDDQAPQATA
eukprot:Stramenopile-MAST_4_protein_4733